MREEIRLVLTKVKTGALSVIDFETGIPFGALVNVATDTNCLPVFLISNLARHTKCLLANPAASLLVAELPAVGDPLVGFRATITGRMYKLKDKLMRNFYLQKHPYAETYVDFDDFNFWQLKPDKVFVVGGFGRIKTFGANEVF